MQSTPEDLAARVLSARDEGYRRIKIKITPGRDVAYARAAREALGDDIALTVDANGSYSAQNEKHIKALEEIDTLGLSMIEQPLAHDDLVHHADLQRLLATPICLDESISGDPTTEEMLALGSARIVNLKPGRVGGFQQALAIHDRCADAGVPVWCGGMLESGIGRAYNVALASLPNFTLPGDLSPSARYWERDIITQPWTMDKAGRVKVPLQKSGIGVEADNSFIDELTVRCKTFSA
jgi:o-succinylbenzoic acid (OSB) synthetase